MIRGVEMYINSILTPSVIGKKRKLYKIFGESEKCIVVPLDDNLISHGNPGLKDLNKKISEIESAKPNGILCYYGTASLIKSLEIPLILNITASTVLSNHTRKKLVSTVQQAMTMDASAVAVHINLSSRYESEMLESLGAVANACQKYGMPLLAIAYPRKESVIGDENYSNLKSDNPDEYTEMVSHCVRVAFELGADIIKTQYTGTTASFSKVVAAACGRPVLIAGGALCDECTLYDMVEGAITAGAAGVSIGRNVFNRPNSSEIISNIRKIVFR